MTTDSFSIRRLGTSRVLQFGTHAHGKLRWLQVFCDQDEMHDLFPSYDPASLGKDDLMEITFVVKEEEDNAQ